MPLSTPAALAVAVVISALGAVVLCLLVALYGFTPASELSPRRARRRQLVIGIGHALAASCFAATAILLAIVLVQSRHPAAPPLREDARVPALGTQLAGQESRLTGHESRLAGQESRLAEAEARLEAIDDTVRRAAAREARPAAPAVQRASAPPRQATRTPAARAVPPPERAPAPEVVVVRPPSVPPATVVRPYDVEGSAFTVPSATPRVAPLAATPSPSAATLPVPPPAPPARAAAERAAPPAASPRTGLLDKLREDWATIRRSFESGEDDFRRAMEDTRRNFRGLVGE
jgi:hypothetical protein